MELDKLYKPMIKEVGKYARGPTVPVPQTTDVLKIHQEVS